MPQKLHLYVGIVGLIVFILTGAYMAETMDALQNMDDGPRMGYRTAHIYLFFASALNIVLSMNGRSEWHSKLAKPLDKLARFVILNAPLGYLYGFFLESADAVAGRPITAVVTLALFGAIVLILLMQWFERGHAQQANDN